jgi:hypothetical protein
MKFATSLTKAESRKQMTEADFDMDKIVYSSI